MNLRTTTTIVAVVVAVHAALLLLFLWVHPARPPAPAAPATPPAPVTDPVPAVPRPSALTPIAVNTAGLPGEPLTRRESALPARLAQATNRDCRTGILIDWSKREVLWQKNPDQAVPIASLTKMMTALLLMEAVRGDAHLALTDKVRVTAEAARVEGSQVYLDSKETFTLDELLKCMMIHSANDCAYLIAQHLGQGQADTFVARMNARAQQLGLTHCRFRNPHGLPPEGGGEENHASTLEVAYLAARLLEYPEVVRWSSAYVSRVREHTTNYFLLVNRNRLVKDCPGVNGMKTGFTQKAGFCVAATCCRNGRILIAVVTGCESEDRRNRLVSDLLTWGYTGSVSAAPATRARKR